MGNRAGGWLGRMLAAVGVLLLAACGDGGSGSGGTGTLQVALTDAVDQQFNSVVLSIEEVRVAPAGSEGQGDSGLPLVVSYNSPKVVDVLDLAFQQELLGSAVLPAGRYSQVRLILSENADPNAPANYLVLADDPTGEHLPLTTPSGQTSGVKIVTGGGFRVEAGVINAVVLDFDPHKAIVQRANGEWNFKPTGIRVVQLEALLETFGSLSGSVLPQVAWNSAVVSAVSQGAESAIASGQVDPDSGEFILFLPPDRYEVRAVAEGFQTFSSLPTLYNVVENFNSVIAAPIELVPE